MLCAFATAERFPQEFQLHDSVVFSFPCSSSCACLIATEQVLVDRAKNVFVCVHARVIGVPALSPSARRSLTRSGIYQDTDNFLFYRDHCPITVPGNTSVIVLHNNNASLLVTSDRLSVCELKSQAKHCPWVCFYRELCRHVTL